MRYVRLQVTETLKAEVTDKSTLCLGFLVFSSLNKSLHLLLDCFGRVVTCQAWIRLEEQLCAALLLLLNVILLQDLKSVGERGLGSEGLGRIQVRQGQLSDRIDRIVNSDERGL